MPDKPKSTPPALSRRTLEATGDEIVTAYLDLWRQGRLPWGQAMIGMVLTLLRQRDQALKAVADLTAASNALVARNDQLTAALSGALAALNTCHCCYDNPDKEKRHAAARESALALVRPAPSPPPGGGPETNQGGGERDARE
jgi:hypothetical protein